MCESAGPKPLLKEELGEDRMEQEVVDEAMFIFELFRGDD
jgi:hypothetical protein